MKRLTILTIPLLAAVCAAGSITANAAVGGTIYPEDDEFIKTLTFTSLSDYAVEDGLYAFADGRMVKVFSDGNYYEYGFDCGVLSVDVKESTIYCGCTDGKAYTLTDQTACEYSFPQKADRFLCDEYLYNIVDGKMYISDLSSPLSPPVTYDGEYTNIKQYGDKIYALNGNSLVCFSGTQYGEVELKYADYSATREVTVGQAVSALKSYAPVQFVEIAENAFMTAVDLEKLDGEYFVPLKTVKAGQNTTALLLCYSGNAAIVSIGDTGYIVLKTKVTEIDIDCSTEKDIENAQMIGGMIYASPYVVSGTVSSSDTIGSTVKVLNKLEYDEVLESVFYEVEYTAGDESVKGYVAEGFLSEVIFGENNTPSEITDPAYSEDNDTKTILIVFAVVLLVLAAIGYISHVSAKGKKKGKKKKEKDTED